MRALESYRQKDIIGVEELTNVAAALVERYTDEPDRRNVRMTVTQRIVRHYLAEDLLGEPSGQSGSSTVFNYGNLLRLLAVKKLLADNWSLQKIREFMSALDITALEQLVNSALAPEAQRAQIKRAATDPAARRVQYPRDTQGRSPQTPPPRTSLFAASPTAPSEPPSLTSLVVESARRANRGGDEWIEIATGLEVRVRRSFRPPRTKEERDRLAKRFWAVIGDKDEG